MSTIIEKAKILTSPWQWRSWQNFPYLTCDLLSIWPHGFFTSLFYPRLPLELSKILAENATVYTVNQVHGNIIVSPTQISQLEICPADGLISEQPHQSLWVASADCTPVLIGDCHTKRVAAIHAGWRGTAKSIVKVAIARFQDLGSNLPDLRIAIGPAISGQVYQVHRDVAAQVCSTITTETDPTTIIDLARQLPNSPIFADPDPEKVRLHVSRVIEEQLLQMGIASEQIAIAPLCTYSQPEYFFSYRRTQQKQVQWSGIIHVL